MQLTSHPCPHCGHHLFQHDHDPARRVCPNAYCPEKFDDTCPFCHSADKTVRLVRIGAAAFTCSACGEHWDRSNGGLISARAKVVVINFRRLPKAS